MNLKRTSKGIMRMSIKAVAYILIVIVVYELALYGYGMGQKIFSESGYEAEPGRDITVTITSSMSKLEIAELLEERGVVEDKWIFYIQSLLYEAKYKDGEYTLNNSWAPEELIQTMSKTDEEKES